MHYSDRNQLANLISLLEQQKLQQAEKSRSATPSTIDSDLPIAGEGKHICHPMAGGLLHCFVNPFGSRFDRHAFVCPDVVMIETGMPWAGLLRFK